MSFNSSPPDHPPEQLKKYADLFRDFLQDLEFFKKEVEKAKKEDAIQERLKALMCQQEALDDMKLDLITVQNNLQSCVIDEQKYREELDMLTVQTIDLLSTAEKGRAAVRLLYKFKDTYGHDSHCIWCNSHHERLGYCPKMEEE